MSFFLEKATNFFSRAQHVALNLYFHNDNAPKDSFALALRENGKAKFFWPKNKPVVEAVEWSVNTTFGKVKPGKEASYAPVCRNKDDKSRWAAYDCDSHDGNTDRAEKLATAIYQCARRLASELAIVLVKTANGWHVWLIAATYWACSKWSDLQDKIDNELGATPSPGRYERWPVKNAIGEFVDKPLRSLASYNPKSNELDSIAAIHNLPVLLSIIGDAGGASFSKRERRDKREKGHPCTKIIREEGTSTTSIDAVIAGAPATAENGADGYDPKSSLYKLWPKTWGPKFKIETTGTRHNLLANLMGEVFHQVGRDMALRIAKAQFDDRTVKTAATLDEHLEDAAQLWAGLQRRWELSLSPIEIEAFKQLKSEVQTDAFRIIRSFNRNSGLHNYSDFPIGMDDLAARIGITPQYAGKLRFRFEESELIKRTQNFVPRKLANRYKWCPQNMLARPATPGASVPQTPTAKRHRLNPLMDILVKIARCPTHRRDLWGPYGIEKTNELLLRLERSLCVHHQEKNDNFVFGPREESRPVRLAIESMAAKAYRGEQVKPADENLLTTFPATTLREAFEIACACGILDENGNKGPSLVLGSQLSAVEKAACGVNGKSLIAGETVKEGKASTPSAIASCV